MEFFANPGKNCEIEAGGRLYRRHAIRTHFITTADDILSVVSRYASPCYRQGDLLSISEKIVAICQGRIIRRDEIQIGLWARLLSRFACRQNRGGYGVGMPINMQYAINKVGLIKVLYAAVAAGIGKLRGRHGIFYAIVGQEVAGLDGFYDGAWEAYRDIGIEIPHDPSGVCEEIRRCLGISCMIVDANDFGQVILGYSADITLSEAELRQLIADNPAGQGQQCTPLILIRPQ